VRVWITSTPTSVPASENLPPASEVPPITTARIASSSMKSPALFASAAMTLELILRPAMPANSPASAYTVQMIVRAWTHVRAVPTALDTDVSVNIPIPGILPGNG
jgi:hypothetical protein